MEAFLTVAMLFLVALLVVGGSVGLVMWLTVKSVLAQPPRGSSRTGFRYLDSPELGRDHLFDFADQLEQDELDRYLEGQGLLTPAARRQWATAARIACGKQDECTYPACTCVEASTIAQDARWPSRGAANKADGPGTLSDAGNVTGAVSLDKCKGCGAVGLVERGEVPLCGRCLPNAHAMRSCGVCARIREGLKRALGRGS